MDTLQEESKVSKNQMSQAEGKPLNPTSDNFAYLESKIHKYPNANKASFKGKGLFDA